VIDPTTFGMWMGTWAERLGGKALSAPTSAAYYAALSRELTTEQFDAAMQIVFATHRFNTWPAPAEIIAAVKCAPDDRIAAVDAFDGVVRIVTGYATPGTRESSKTYREEQLLREFGSVASTAYRCTGGWRRFRDMTESAVEYVRRDFLEHYGHAAESERVIEALTSVEPQYALPATHAALPAGERT
jgi:hypothetical protein